MTAREPTSVPEVWTTQGHSDGLEGWLVGGVFSSLETACEFAEAWVSDKSGVEVYVYRRPLDRTYGERAPAIQEATFKAPAIFQEPR